jgi:hypothetical protein
MVIMNAMRLLILMILAERITMTKTIDEISKEIADILIEYKFDEDMSSTDVVNKLLSIEVGGEVQVYCKLGKNWYEVICATNCSGCEYLVADRRTFDCVMNGKLNRPKTVKDCLEGTI